MNNIRWESPFPYTLAFNLFKKHLEEIHRAYWAFVPAANTIKSLAKKNLVNDEVDPKNFFDSRCSQKAHIKFVRKLELSVGVEKKVLCGNAIQVYSIRE